MSPEAVADTIDDVASGASESEDTEAEEKGGFIEALLTPEGLFMFGSAIFFDVAEIFIAGIPALDVIAGLIIGGWIFTRSGEVTTPQKRAKQVEKIQEVATKAAKWSKRLKWVRFATFIAEFIPLIGMIPGWTVTVYFELKHGGSPT